MDRELLERRRAEAERRIPLGFALIAEQRQVVGQLEAWGKDATTARRMLRTFEEMQGRTLDDLETVMVQLDADDERRKLGR